MNTLEVSVSQLSRRAFLGGGLAVGFGLLAGCSDDSAPGGGTNSGGGSKSALMGRNTTNNFTHVPLLVAERKGYFQEAGLDLSTTGLASATLPTALLRGDITSGYLGVAGTFMSLKQKGEDVVCVALATKNNPNIFVASEKFMKKVGISLDAPPVERLKALATARFAATDPGAGTDVTVRSVMENVGVDPNSLNITYLKDIGTFPGAMQEDNIDAFAVFSPVPEQVEAGGFGHVYLPLASSGLPEFTDMAWTAVWMQRKTAQENPDVAKGIAGGLAKALALIQSNPNEARDAIRDDFKELSDEVFQKAWENNLPGYPATPRLEAAAVQKAIDLNNATAKEQYTDAPETLFTNEYLPA